MKLRKIGTNRTFERTPQLADRDDMVAISDKEAEECQKRLCQEQKEGVDRRKRAMSQIAEKAVEKTEDEILAKLKRNDLEKICHDNKLFFEEKDTDAQLREYVRQAAAVKAQADATAGVTAEKKPAKSKAAATSEKD